MQTNSLQKFLTDIALDPARYASFLHDPAAALREAGVAEGAHAVLQTKDQKAVEAYLAEESGGEGQSGRPGARIVMTIRSPSPGPMEQVFSPLR
jgi:hypothetical protein